jgi:hypothetical protein
VPSTSLTDADRLAAAVATDLPPATTWTMPPRGYRQALALCVVDGVARELLEGPVADALVATVRTMIGDDADQAPVTVLMTRSDALPTVPAEVVGTIRSAATLLADRGLSTTADLVGHLKAEGRDGDLGSAWCGVQGLTRRMWTNTAMLAGYLDPEVDRVIAAYVARAIGSDPATTPADRVIAALTEVAERFGSAILPLEFAILRRERP